MLTPQESSAAAKKICALAPIVPVLVVEDAKDAKPLATALVTGGLPALEVTLRTPAALEVIAEMASVEGGYVGAGTLITPEDVFAAKEAGATFGVSPGSTPELLQAALEADLPMLPAAVTATEAMNLLVQGYDMLKFFPAEAVGGAKALGSLAGPLPQITYCPTGGINLGNAKSYLSLPNVICAGGSWIAPKSAVEAGDWAGITALAREAATSLRA